MVFGGDDQAGRDSRVSGAAEGDGVGLVFLLRRVRHSADGAELQGRVLASRTSACGDRRGGAAVGDGVPEPGVERADELRAFVPGGDWDVSVFRHAVSRADRDGDRVGYGDARARLLCARDVLGVWPFAATDGRRARRIGVAAAVLRASGGGATRNADPARDANATCDADATCDACTWRATAASAAEFGTRSGHGRATRTRACLGRGRRIARPAQVRRLRQQRPHAPAGRRQLRDQGTARINRSMRASRANQIASANYRLPANASGVLRFCLVAWDRAGNASGKSCARLTVI